MWTHTEDPAEAAPAASRQEDEEDGFPVFASVQWLDGYRPQKCKIALTKVLQSWINTNNHNISISVVKASEDGSAEMKIKPASALKLLNTLRGQTLTTRDRNRVTVQSFSLTPAQMETEEPAAASVNLSSSSSSSSSSSLPDTQNEQVKLEEESSSASGPAAAEETHTCSLPVSHFLYVSHIYKEEMQRIEKESGVEIAAEVTVTFKPQGQKGGDPKKALSDFINLVQKSLAESNGSTVPLKFVDPEQWKETLKIIQKKENKVFVTLSSEELTVCGPRQSQDVITETLNTSERSMESHAIAAPLHQHQKVTTSPLGHTPPPGASGFNDSVKNNDYQSEGASRQDVITETLNTSENTNKATCPSQDTPLKIDMKTKDPLTAGLTVEEDHRKPMTTPVTVKVDAIKPIKKSDWEEFVDFATPRQRKVDGRRAGGRRSMEGHAITAPLYLDQKVTTSPPGHTSPPGASGFNSSIKNNDKQSEGASSQDVIPKTLKTSEKTKDPLTAGLAVKEYHWKLMTTSFTGEETMKERLALLQRQLNVLTALQHQSQKPTTSVLGHASPPGASGFNRSVKNSDYQSKGASSGPVSTGQSEGDNEDDTCPICMDTFKNKKTLKCKHEFCEGCLKRAEEVSGSICPVCRDVFGKMEGDQPEGTMSWRTSTMNLPGFSQCGTIIIDYYIPSAIQTEKHPNPGKWFTGAQRTAYLPDNREGRDVLRLLARAFEQKLVFTVGTSRTTGRNDQVTWNGILHKTSTQGGPQSFGYPDPDYLSRVRDELKAKGIK